MPRRRREREGREPATGARPVAVAGPRKEDIAQAEAQLAAQEAQLEFLKQQLADGHADRAGRRRGIRSRLMEPGEMASPQKPVFTLAIILAPPGSIWDR